MNFAIESTADILNSTGGIPLGGMRYARTEIAYFTREAAYFSGDCPYLMVENPYCYTVELGVKAPSVFERLKRLEDKSCIRRQA